MSVDFIELLKDKQDIMSHDIDHFYEIKIYGAAAAGLGLDVICLVNGKPMLLLIPACKV